MNTFLTNNIYLGPSKLILSSFNIMLIKICPTMYTLSIKTQFTQVHLSIEIFCISQCEKKMRKCIWKNCARLTQAKKINFFVFSSCRSKNTFNVDFSLWGKTTYYLISQIALFSNFRHTIHTFTDGRGTDQQNACIDNLISKYSHVNREQKIIYHHSFLFSHTVPHGHITTSDVVGYPKPEGKKHDFVIPDPTLKNGTRTPTRPEFWLLL